MKITHLPFDGDFKVTWRYGAKASFAGTNDGKHHGIDLIGITDKKVYSTCEGVVAFAGWDPSGFGNYVKIVEDTTGLAHYFAHLEKITVTKNQRVTYTTQLGIMGDTGNVTGPHTHYEIRNNGTHINPTKYMGIPNKEGEYNAKDYLIELKPPQPETFWVEVYKEIANVRKEPTTNSILTGSKKLYKGDKFEALEIVKGQSIQGIDTWYKSKKGNYVWSYGLKNNK